MKVKDLRKMLKELPPSMEVCVLDGDELFSGCRGQSQIIEATIDNKEQNVFLITPCKCNEPEFNLN